MLRVVASARVQLDCLGLALGRPDPDDHSVDFSLAHDLPQSLLREAPVLGMNDLEERPLLELVEQEAQELLLGEAGVNPAEAPGFQPVHHVDDRELTRDQTCVAGAGAVHAGRRIIKPAARHRIWFRRPRARWRIRDGLGKLGGFVLIGEALRSLRHRSSPVAHRPETSDRFRGKPGGSREPARGPAARPKPGPGDRDES